MHSEFICTRTAAREQSLAQACGARSNGIAASAPRSKVGAVPRDVKGATAVGDLPHLQHVLEVAGSAASGLVTHYSRGRGPGFQTVNIRGKS